MSCAEVGRHVRELDHRLMRDRIALNAALYYPSLLAYTPDLREPLLVWQQRTATGHLLLERAFNRLHGWLDRRPERAVRERFHHEAPTHRSIASEYHRNTQERNQV